MRYEDGVPKIPAAALSNPDADLLASEVATGKAVRFRLKLETQSLPEAESANVIGEVRGRGKPEEIVLLGAHLDSWDLGTGAIDDGAGVAIITETARRIAQLPEKERPMRTIRVVLFANEEFGLSGARAYAAAHAAELPRHVVALESDLGANRVWRIESHVAKEALPAVSEIFRLIYIMDITSGGNLAEGGADLTPLTAGGVPVLGLDQDATVYFNWHHTANDTPDKVSAIDLNQNVATWVATVYSAAQLPGGFGRAPAPEAEKP
jgi:Zn-dependent M28 family amino/carboxypeptidase